MVPNTEPLSSLLDPTKLSEFSIERHEDIADRATALLSQRAADRVSSIMSVLPREPSPDLSLIAGWADRVKRRKPQADDDPDTVAFLEDPQNDKTDTWHFVDLPLDCASYDRVKFSEFTRDEDVVQMLGQAIDVFSAASQRFSPLNALRLVVHLVGDVHQPLHVGCCYVAERAGEPVFVRDPAQASGLESDHGGNRVILPIGDRGINLHSYWDSRLGGKGALPASVPAATRPDPAGDPRDWPREWASESLSIARAAYTGIRETRFADDGKSIVVEFDRDEYEARCVPLISERMTTAAQNLARLLNTILK